MRARLRDLDVHYEISGQGPWLMLSHSLAANLDMWRPQLAALEPHYTVLRYDTRGHGGTQATPAPYTLEQLADDAQALLQHLGVARAHWLGLSMGGMVGQMLALRHPEILGRVVLADTAAQQPPAAPAIWAERIATARGQGMKALAQPTLARWFTEPFRNSQPQVMAEIGAMIEATPVEGYAGCCAAIAQLNTLERLRTLKHPALVIVGEQDPGTPPAMAEQICAHWPGAQLVRLPDASHLANIEQAEGFNQAVLGFLRG